MSAEHGGPPMTELEMATADDLIAELQTRFPSTVVIWSTDGDDCGWKFSGGLNAAIGLVERLHTDLINESDDDPEL